MKKFKIYNTTDMKKIGITILLTAIIIHGISRTLSAENPDTKKQDTIVNPGEATKVTIGKDLISVQKTDSAVDLKVGNRELDILESLEGSKKFRFEKYSDNEKWNKWDRWDQDDNDDRRERRRNRFRGHWAGIELGLNNYLTSGNSMVLPDNINYMTLNSSQSINFNINFSQLSIGLTRHFGFVTGLGLNWNNYRFDGNNNIQKGTDGVIEELDPGSNLDKSKLATVFLDLPVMLEVQIPVNDHRLHIAAGPIGAIKLGSHTKMVFQDGPTIKSYGDFSLNMLRYGATARVGYGNFQLYGTYYMTPLFQTGKSPAGVALYPFEIGIALAFND